MRNPEDGSQPIGHPKVEIYAIEMAAGLSESDARNVSGIDWTMLIEPGEKVPHKRNRVQIQTLRRMNARLAVLAEIERGLDPVEHREFLFRNRRAVAELRWFKMVIEAGGVEPDFDEDGQLIPQKKKSPNRQTRGQYERSIQS